MKSFFSLPIVIGILIPSFLSAQIQAKQTDTVLKKSIVLRDTTISEVVSDSTILKQVEVEASFPGGDAAWKLYLIKKLSGFNPAANGASEGAYTVYVQFIVDRDGNISDVKALTNYGHKMEDKVVEIIKKGPRWNPAIQDGRAVKAYRKQPVTFVVMK